MKSLADLDEKKMCPACNDRSSDRYDFFEGSIFGCDSCNLQWARHKKLPESDAIKNPDSFYMKPQSCPQPENYKPYRDFFRFVNSQMHGRKMRILDLGCGNGVFLNLALKLGHDAYGVEPDQSLAAVMSPEVKSRVSFCVAEEFEAKGTYDLITFWDSFEHMENPFELIQLLRSYLSPGGIIFLRVNNRHDIYNKLTDLALKCHRPTGLKLLKGSFNFPEHVWNFSAAAMKQMLDRAGHKIMHSRFTDTPAERLSENHFVVSVFKLAYAVNRAIGGGKIGEYYIQPISQ